MLLFFSSKSLAGLTAQERRRLLFLKKHHRIERESYYRVGFLCYLFAAAVAADGENLKADGASEIGLYRYLTGSVVVGIVDKYRKELSVILYPGKGVEILFALGASDLKRVVHRAVPQKRIIALPRQICVVVEQPAENRRARVVVYKHIDRRLLALAH